MRNWSRIVGAFCIVSAMVLGAFAGLVSVRPGIVGAAPDAGTRAEDRRLLSASDGAQRVFDPDVARDVADAGAGPVSLLGSAPVEIRTPDGAVAKRAGAEDQRRALSRAPPAGPSEGTITVTRSESTPGTRYVGPGVDAGGPYGGPDAFEGTVLTLTVIANDPAILFFRWDFNNDGTFDYPDQTGGGTIGRWTTQASVTRRFLDNYFGDVVAQGWDGVSTYVQINLGTNLNEQTAFQWFIGYGEYTFAWQFRAKADLTVTALGHYHYVYPLFDQGLWDTSGNLLGECTPVHQDLEWNWCTLGTPVNLVLGQEYRIGIRIQSWTTAIDTPDDTDKVQFEGTYYCYNPGALCSPDSFWLDFFIPQVDFKWREVLILPDAASDTAFLEVNNVAPLVSGVRSDPDPAWEGTATDLLATFDDPGLDDTWEYRWSFADGTASDWLPVSKYSGGARVLILHSWTGDVVGFKGEIATACGAFCVKLDDLDFGPLGQNRVPSMDELLAYDVLLVGTNWGPIPSPDGMGDRLADYMDAGGDVVMMFAGFTSNNVWGIGGRWQDEGYSPIGRVGFAFFDADLGTIYVPGHPLFDGVGTMGSFYRHDAFDITSGATRIADFTDGRVLAAEKFQPNGACALGLPWFPGFSRGDSWQVVVNALRYCSQRPDPVLKTMPIDLDPYRKAFADDEPTTTAQDAIAVAVEVRDDDDGRLEIRSQTELYVQDFEDIASCQWEDVDFDDRPDFLTWPPGWVSDPDWGWRCEYQVLMGSRGPGLFYWYNDPNYGTGDGTSELTTHAFDFSPYDAVRIEFYSDWRADYPFGTSDGFVEASLDGGRTFPIEITAYHHDNPGQAKGAYATETTALGAAADVVIRFRYESNDDYWWFLDDLRITGLVGEVVVGLGSAGGTLTIANVVPTIVGGFDDARRDEAQAQLFKGFEITDPALLQPTEWFAYRWNFDDGSPSEWVYRGSLAPPRLDVFVIQTLCLSGNSCPEYASLRDTLLAQDDVASVTPFNFINYPNLPTAPDLTTMKQYDVLLVATNWAYISYPPFDLARRQIGDRLAAYLDSGRGGVLTLMAVYDLSAFYGDIFSLNGRYIDEDYGPFERTEYLFGEGVLGTIHDPEHDLFTRVDSGEVGSLYIHSGDYKVTRGGSNAAAGRDGVLLADWQDGNSAVGVKELSNGMRTVHIGMFGQPSGSDTGMLLRNAVGWASGGIPSPKIAPFAHTWGDNGVYTVDLTVIDDDMGWTWDPRANEPVLALPGAPQSHRYVSVSVDNVDPTIVRKEPDSMQAFIASTFCLRVSGTKDNTVTLEIFRDGDLMSTLRTTRVTGDPNPPDEKCAMVKVDVRNPASYDAVFTYDAPNGGDNPTWLIIEPWREPISPGHGTTTYKYDFEKPTKTSAYESLATLKQDLFADGMGAPIDFAIEAYDSGTDDLAFLWSWGAEGGVPYALDPESVYTIHVFHNNGDPRSDGRLETTQFLGFSEFYFDRDRNVGRSPDGTTNFRVRDTVTRAFPGGQGVYFVMVVVLDDDNARGYPSQYLTDGMDFELITIDLR